MTNNMYTVLQVISNIENDKTLTEELRKDILNDISKDNIYTTVDELFDDLNREVVE